LRGHDLWAGTKFPLFWYFMAMKSLVESVFVVKVSPPKPGEALLPCTRAHAREGRGRTCRAPRRQLTPCLGCARGDSLRAFAEFEGLRSNLAHAVEVACRAAAEFSHLRPFPRRARRGSATRRPGPVVRFFGGSTNPPPPPLRGGGTGAFLTSDIRAVLGTGSPTLVFKVKPKTCRGARKPTRDIGVNGSMICFCGTSPPFNPSQRHKRAFLRLSATYDPSQSCRV